LNEAKLTDAESDASLQYFATRLDPLHIVQIVRHLAYPRPTAGHLQILPAASFRARIKIADDRFSQVAYGHI
jgi:hypothetical protein